MRHPDVRARRARTGAVLLEVIVALTMLAVAGAATVALASASLRAVVRARAAESAMRRASGFLAAVALWPREDLDRHLGAHPQGPWRLRVDRVAPTLYAIALADSTDHDATHPLLATSLYRPEVDRATP
jgi:type II secretory pathway pseudopilin PulG